MRCHYRSLWHGIGLAALLVLSCEGKYARSKTKHSPATAPRANAPAAAQDTTLAEFKESHLLARVSAELALPAQRKLAAGSDHTCRIDHAGALLCWGSHRLGARGTTASGSSSATPWRVSGDLRFRTVAASARATCAIDTTGALFCWGENTVGQLGDGSREDRSQPVRVSEDRTWSDVSLGDKTCAVTTDGGLYCWGGLRRGGGFDAYIVQPTRVGGQQNWARVAVGDGTVCALDRAGRVACWGDNSVEQLGLFGGDAGVVSNRTANGFIALSLRKKHVCGIRADASLWCWGYNHVGQLGRDWAKRETGGRPARVEGEWNRVAVNVSHTCAVRLDRSLWCWGDNSSLQLGRTRANLRRHVPHPVRVGLTADWLEVEAGYKHTCAEKADGRVKCWGGDAEPGLPALGDASMAEQPLSFEPLAPAELDAEILRGAPADERSANELTRALAGAVARFGSAEALAARLYEARGASAHANATLASVRFPICAALVGQIRSVTGSAALLALSGIDLWPERFGYSLEWPAGPDRAPVVVSFGRATNPDLVATLPAIARTRELSLPFANARLFVTPNGLAVLLVGPDYAIASRIDTLTKALSRVPSDTHAVSAIECTLRMEPKQHGLPTTLAATILASDSSSYDFRMIGQFSTDDQARSALHALVAGVPRQAAIMLGSVLRFDPKRLQWADKVIGYVSSADLHSKQPNSALLFRWLLESEKPFNQVLAELLFEYQQAAP